MERKTGLAAIPIVVALVLAAGLTATGLLVGYLARDRQPALAVLVAPAVLPAASVDPATVVPPEPPARAAASSLPASDERAFAGKPGETYRVGELARSFDRLAALADGGDMIALRTLVDGLHACGGGSRLAASRPGETGLRQPADEDLRRAGSGMRPRSRTPCAGLGPQHLGRRQDWLERLAERGSVEDRLRYVETGAPVLNAADPGFTAAWTTYRERIGPYLEEAIAAGHVRALADMARAQRDVYRRDDTLVFAYLYAYALARGKSASDMAASAPLSLEQARARLTPEQTDRAVALGEDIVRRCCVR